MTTEQVFTMMVQSLMRSAVKSIGGSFGVSVGTVKEVNESEGTCVVEREEMPELHDVRLNAVIDEKVTDKFTIIPSVGSYVLVLALGEATEGLVLSTSKIDKVIIQTGEITVNVSASGIVMNGGKLGGMINIESLTGKINDLVTAFNNHTHVVSTGGTANPVDSKASSLSKGDYEDEKVKH